MMRVLWGRGAAGALAAALVAGCATVDDHPKPVLIPNQELNLSKSIQIPLESLVAGAAIFFIVDPLAPNWEVKEQRVAADLFRLTLRKKRFTTGGDGEAIQVFQRRAEQLMREHGYSAFRVLQFTEGIESTLPIAQRVSQGTIQLAKTP